MSSPLKRKRSAASSSRDPSTSLVAAPIRQGQSSVHALADGPSPTRAELEKCVGRLSATMLQLEALVHRLPDASPRAVLSELSAPAQSSSSQPAEGNSDSRKASELSCSSCADLQQRVRELEAREAAHEKEKEAWAAFKQWWLRSLAKKERSNRQRSPKSSPIAAVLGKSSSPRRQRTSTLSAFNKLDPASREIWIQAGIVDGPSSSSQLDANINEPVPGPSAREVPTVGGESGPSEPILPVAGARRDVGWIDSTPVRSRIQRRTMIAHDCPDCASFYSHLNELRPNNPGDAERNACSRHRTTHARPATPEGYWNIGFPTTQDAELINDSARKARPPR
ncbi:hypothetical protein PaG_03812 [Moesziomyces aphidis]|uniref:DNA endonuclease activator Ctp1 C-terminal domain-containing protein n=2 Tax=Moesziomyces TaxID=63261 RepID=M9MFH8_PSEA3|nr:hypothetical protein PaG_03812 [Moesziomyces aphidis]GAC76193.1 hypothetical protein PANT_19c00141 [Moesziomyces antarcticus T-34]